MSISDLLKLHQEAVFFSSIFLICVVVVEVLDDNNVGA